MQDSLIGLSCLMRQIGASLAKLRHSEEYPLSGLVSCLIVTSLSNVLGIMALEVINGAVPAVNL